MSLDSTALVCSRARLEHVKVECILIVLAVSQTELDSSLAPKVHSPYVRQNGQSRKYIMQGSGMVKGDLEPSFNPISKIFRFKGNEHIVIGATPLGTEVTYTFPFNVIFMYGVRATHWSRNMVSPRL